MEALSIEDLLNERWFIGHHCVSLINHNPGSGNSGTIFVAVLRARLFVTAANTWTTWMNLIPLSAIWACLIPLMQPAMADLVVERHCGTCTQTAAV